MEDCIFCKIIKGEIPSSKVYEDDDVYAFLDITPVNPGHTLVIPKTHGKDIFEVDDEMLGNLIVAVKKISKGVIKAVETDGFNLHLNTGPVSGQVVDHFHFHIIPRFENDGKMLWKGKEYESEVKKNEITERIRKEL